VSVTVKLEIPDDLATILSSGGRDLSRAALEALAVEAYRTKQLTDLEFRRILGLSRLDADAILKARGVWLDYSLEDFNCEGEADDRLSPRSE
jgi:predicted HTH domain antitoxin